MKFMIDGEEFNSNDFMEIRKHLSLHPDSKIEVDIGIAKLERREDDIISILTDDFIKKLDLKLEVKVISDYYTHIKIKSNNSNHLLVYLALIYQSIKEAKYLKFIENALREDMIALRADRNKFTNSSPVVRFLDEANLIYNPYNTFEHYLIKLDKKKLEYLFNNAMRHIYGFGLDVARKFDKSGFTLMYVDDDALNDIKSKYKELII